MVDQVELAERVAKLVAENRQLKADVGRLGIGCRHLLACMEMCDEAGAPPCELGSDDLVLIEETKREVAAIAGDAERGAPNSTGA